MKLIWKIKQINSKKLSPNFFLTFFFTSFHLSKQHTTALISFYLILAFKNKCNFIIFFLNRVTGGFILIFLTLRYFEYCPGSELTLYLRKKNSWNTCTQIQVTHHITLWLLLLCWVLLNNWPLNFCPSNVTYTAVYLVGHVNILNTFGVLPKPCE